MKTREAVRRRLRTIAKMTNTDDAIEAIEALSQESDFTAQLIAKFLKTKDVEWNPKDEPARILLEMLWEKSKDPVLLLEVALDENAQRLLREDESLAYLLENVSILRTAFLGMGPLLQLDAVLSAFKKAQDGARDEEGYIRLAGAMLAEVNLGDTTPSGQVQKLVLDCLDVYFDRNSMFDLSNIVACVELSRELGSK